ncbi:MAG TPA: acyl-CoA carboxylase epsilon subunit, partial [Mycobacterium sp.]|nr:acyl-CoA carboxylase epsilon subunit [Mycobacterium sp.]
MVSDDHTDTGATQPLVRVLRGQPTDAEVAALVAVVAGAGGGAGEPGPVLRNLWGHPVDKLRFGAPSWQRVTLLE